MTTTKTAGQALACALRSYLRVGPRTRDGRDRSNGQASVKAYMMEVITNAANYDGWYCEETTTALRPGVGAVRAHEKHIEGYRADGRVIQAVRCMTPWQFAAFLGEMVDAGITNVGEGERFYAAMRQQVAA